MGLNDTFKEFVLDQLGALPELRAATPKPAGAGF
jgi:hypothetical protein